jgi:hypothetical protein
MWSNATSADVAAIVARRGGSAHLSLRWDNVAGAFRVTTTSPNRDDVIRTLAIADSVMKQKLAEEQAGRRQYDPLQLVTLNRQNA